MYELLYNQRIKKYPSGMQVVTTFSYPVFDPLHRKQVGKVSGKDLISQEPVFDTIGEDSEIEYIDGIPVGPLPFGPDLSGRMDNLKRAKEKVFDIAYMNVFDYFCTLTFDDSKVNANDEDEVHRVMTNWFKNMVKRNNCKYLAVPEFHKSGRIHWHMLISGNLTLIDSGTVLIPERKKPVRREYAQRICFDMSYARTVYNLKEWRNGFSTVIEFRKCNDGGDGTTAIAKYLTKYMTKDLSKVLKHYYYAGGHLEREVPTEYNIVDFDSVSGLPLEVPNSELKVKYMVIGGV